MKSKSPSNKTNFISQQKQFEPLFSKRMMFFNRFLDTINYYIGTIYLATFLSSSLGNQARLKANIFTTIWQSWYNNIMVKLINMP